VTKINSQTKAETTFISNQIHTRNGRRTKLSLGELALRSYSLVDGEEMQRGAPDFWLPSAEMRSALRAGQTVMLVFHQRWFAGSLPERMWVRITGRNKEGYVGRLANEPQSVTALRFGDEVRFTPKNVIKILSLAYIECILEAPNTVRAEAHVPSQ
jgi:hypothetical protein